MICNDQSLVHTAPLCRKHPFNDSDSICNRLQLRTDAKLQHQTRFASLDLEECHRLAARPARVVAAKVFDVANESGG